MGVWTGDIPTERMLCTASFSSCVSPSKPSEDTGMPLEEPGPPRARPPPPPPCARGRSCLEEQDTHSPPSPSKQAEWEWTNTPPKDGVMHGRFTGKGTNLLFCTPLARTFGTSVCHFSGRMLPAWRIEPWHPDSWRGPRTPDFAGHPSSERRVWEPFIQPEPQPNTTTHRKR